MNPLLGEGFVCLVVGVGIGIITAVLMSTTRVYSLHTPLEKIASNPAAAAILNKNIPGLLSSSSYFSFKDMSLKQLAARSGGEITDQMLLQTQSDLKRLYLEQRSGNIGQSKASF